MFLCATELLSVFFFWGKRVSSKNGRILTILRISNFILPFLPLLERREGRNFLMPKKEYIYIVCNQYQYFSWIPPSFFYCGPFLCCFFIVFLRLIFLRFIKKFVSTNLICFFVPFLNKWMSEWVSAAATFHLCWFKREMCLL